jgi:ectoine hydroxylase-related dioxygenase (phytanoyl-CoA dioxygenase family)
MSLDPDQRGSFDRDGYLILRGVLDPDRVAQATAWVEEITGWTETDGPGLHHFEQTDAGPALARSEDLIPHHEGVRSLVTEGTIPDLAGELMGEPAVLYKEKINYKQPGGGGFAPHQDAPAYRFVDHHVSVMVPIDPATTASGCLWVGHGQAPGLLPMEGLQGLRADVVEALEWRPVELAPGDLLWFDSFVPHRSDTNGTDRARRAFYLTYNAASAGDFRTTYYEDKRAELDQALSPESPGTQRVRLSITDDFLGRPVESAPGS